MPLLALVHAALIGPLASAGPGTQRIVSVAEPVVLTAFLTWVCFLLHRVLPKSLYDLPFGIPAPSTALRARAVESSADKV